MVHGIKKRVTPLRKSFVMLGLTLTWLNLFTKPKASLRTHLFLMFYDETLVHVTSRVSKLRQGPKIKKAT